MKLRTALFTTIASALALVTSPQALAVTAETSKAVTSEDTSISCRNAGVFSTKLITNVCWTCVFPVKLSGFVISGDKFKDRQPSNAADSKGLCVCYDELGIGMPGIPSSLWEPFRMAEYVSTPGCSQVLLGKRFPFDRLNEGTAKENDTSDQKNGVQGYSYKHYHYYSFPIATMLSMYIPENCNPGFYNDLDVMYLSEVDPTWQSDELAFFTNPESALFANPFTAISCIPDAFATMVNSTFETLWWCAGSWGTLTPPSGNIAAGTHPLNASSLELSRMMYVMHRRGIEWGTVGKDNACGGSVQLTLPKEQYRFSLFYPVSETEDNHILGRAPIFWGSLKLIPGMSEDPIYIVWRWLDCCS